MTHIVLPRNTPITDTIISHTVENRETQKYVHCCKYFLIQNSRDKRKLTLDVNLNVNIY